MSRQVKLNLSTQAAPHKVTAHDAHSNDQSCSLQSALLHPSSDDLESNVGSYL